MKNIVIVFYLTAITKIALCCDCVNILTELQEQVEQNQASFQHQVIEQNHHKEYMEFKQWINQIAENTKSKRQCIGLVAIYQNFIRDEHGFLFYNEGFKAEKLHKNYKRKKNKESLIDGKWYYQDGSFSINLSTHDSNYLSHIGVIETDYKTGWEKNQIKMELYYDNEKNLKCIYWLSNLIPKVFDVQISNSEMSIGRYLKFYRYEIEYDAEQKNDVLDFEFKELSNKTNYIRIPSFDLSKKSTISKIISNNINLIESKENLIIDVRNNRGGGFEAFKSLLPIVSNTEIVEPPYYGTVWVSSKNFEYYDRTKYEYTETKLDSLEEEMYVDYLKTHIGGFTPIELEKDTIKLLEHQPKNIAIVIDKNSASTTEGFILTASHNPNVTTYGENTMGAVSYGDWMPIELSCLDITVAISTAKMVFKKNEDFERIGIDPEINLSSKSPNDWIDIIKDTMENRKRPHNRVDGREP